MLFRRLWFINILVNTTPISTPLRLARKQTSNYSEPVFSLKFQLLAITTNYNGVADMYKCHFKKTCNRFVEKGELSVGSNIKKFLV